MIIHIHPLSARILKHDYPDGKIHSSEIILDVMMSNFSRRKIKVTEPYLLQTTRSIELSKVKPENLYYYHKHLIFEEAQKVKKEKLAVLNFLREYFHRYDIDDSVYDIDSMYREFTRFINYRSSHKKIIMPLHPVDICKIEIPDHDIAKIVKDNIDFFYHKAGFNFVRYHQLIAYLHKHTKMDLPIAKRTLRHRVYKFKSHLTTNKKLESSIHSVLKTY